MCACLVNKADSDSDSTTQAIEPDAEQKTTTKQAIIVRGSYLIP